jgi:plasmid rolling circle replication initiator protein Rep
MLLLASEMDNAQNISHMHTMYVVTPIYNTNSDMIFVSQDQANSHLVQKNFKLLVISIL